MLKHVFTLKINILFHSLDENYESNKESKSEEISVACIDTNNLVSISTAEEERGVAMFLEESLSSKMRIIDMLIKFCKHVTRLDGFQWTRELSDIFKNAYEIVR